MPEETPAVPAIDLNHKLEHVLRGISLWSIGSFLLQHAAVLAVIGGLFYSFGASYAQSVVDGIIAEKGLAQKQQVEDLKTKLESTSNSIARVERTLRDLEINNDNSKETVDELRAGQREVQSDIKQILRLLATQR